MNPKTVPEKPAPAEQDRPVRTPHVAAARRLTPERPKRAWTLLLPPRRDSK